MNYKHGDWYCEPSTKEEAQEIVERAKASGAKSRSEWAFTARFYGVYKGEVKTYAMGTKYTIDEVRQKFPLPNDGFIATKEFDGIGHIVTNTLKTPLSGVYKTTNCEDAPKETPAVTLICDLCKSIQFAVCADGSLYARDTNFVDYWGEWKPMKNGLVQTPQEWNGEGLPPVGTVCEGIYRGKWLQCEILKHKVNDAGMEVAACDFRVDLAWSRRFRPIRSERDVFIEKASKAFHEAADGEINDHAFGAIYDAIQFGELKVPKG